MPWTLLVRACELASVMLRLRVIVRADTQGGDWGLFWTLERGCIAIGRYGVTRSLGIGYIILDSWQRKTNPQSQLLCYVGETLIIR